MNYGEIKKTDIANGIGVRVSLFVSGCTHRCQGCFNRETWDFAYGRPFTQETEDAILAMLAPDYINGLTLLGGEPMEPDNQRALMPFLERVRQTYPKKNIWCYSGYLLDKDLLPSGGRAHTECTGAMLRLIDILVDGPFIEAQKNISLAFRGSENQRIIDVPQTLATGEIVLWRSETK